MENIAKNIQLQLSGGTCQFDYSPGTDSIVAVSSDSISIHSLKNAGSPRQSFYFDVKLSPNAVFVQKFGQYPMVATLNNHSICLWDTSRPTSTLSDFQFFRDTVTYAFDWSPLNPSLFATAGTNGFISIWDKRTSLSHPAGAAFVGKRVVQHLSWSRFSDIELAALVNDEFILKWDARVISDQIADAETKPRYSILQCNEPTIDVTWKDDSSFWLLSADSISQLKADNERISFPISPGGNDNTTQSFIWNPSQRLCAILSSRRSTCDTLIHFFRVENGACWPVDNLTILGRPAHCFWRQHEDVFVVVTSQGYLRFFDLNIQSRTVTLSHESNTVEEDYFLGRQSYENRWFVGGGDVTRSMYGDLKSLGLVDHSHERAFLEHSAREQLHQHQYHLTMGGTTLKNVVGPRTFYMLLSDELRALEQALKTRMLEGVVLTACDAFNRMLSLDCNMTANTPGSGPIIRTFSMLYSSDHNNNNNHIITLTISFPKKQSHFWNMNFTIENRSHHKVRASFPAPAPAAAPFFACMCSHRISLSLSLCIATVGRGASQKRLCQRGTRCDVVARSRTQSIEQHRGR